MVEVKGDKTKNGERAGRLIFVVKPERIYCRKKKPKKRGLGKNIDTSGQSVGRLSEN